MSDLPLGWEIASLGDVVDVLDSKRIPVNAKERARRPGDVPYYGATGQVGWINDALFNEELLLLGEDGAPFLDPTKAKAYLIEGPSWVNNHAHVLRARSGVTTNRFLKYALDATDFRSHVNGTTRLKLTQKSMNSIPVSLPPLPEQERIVVAVENYLELIHAAAARVMAARSKVEALWRVAVRRTLNATEGLEGTGRLTFDEAFTPVRLPGSVAQSDYLTGGELAVVDQGAGLIGGYTNDLRLRIATESPVIVFGDHTRRVKYVDFAFAVGASGTKVLLPTKRIDPRFAYYVLSDADIEDRGYGRHYSLLRRLPVPDLPLSAQRDVVRRLDGIHEELFRSTETLDKSLLRFPVLRRSVLVAALSGRFTGPARGGTASMTAE